MSDERVFQPGDRVGSATTVGVGTVICERKDGTVKVRWDGNSLTFPVRKSLLIPEPPLSSLMETEEAEMKAKALAELHLARQQNVDAGTNPKDLIGVTKPNLALVPPAAMIHFAKAMENGAAKYGAYNWRDKKVRVMVYLAAAQRHIAQFLDGEDYASDSGVHHLAHAGACMAIALDAIETGNLVDDRPTAGAASRLIADLTKGGK